MVWQVRYDQELIEGDDNIVQQSRRSCDGIGAAVRSACWMGWDFEFAGSPPLFSDWQAASKYFAGPASESSASACCVLTNEVLGSCV
eukprot:CAMPEP_0197858534 /NCGR_PEP_ID=MMETSP1438-20131217/32389_1 /TAXON_ID=1461541 /ORGANISM="Pterosperma sp., Strain CCMP1384" /LENGTH=86 /DNA_ID=CAMNT_0043474721 /DNA_START=98 /DNA_END=358 /DNA_ORIENTATION=-